MSTRRGAEGSILLLAMAKRHRCKDDRVDEEEAQRAQPRIQTRGGDDTAPRATYRPVTTR